MQKKKEMLKDTELVVYKCSGDCSKDGCYIIVSTEDPSDIVVPLMCPWVSGFECLWEVQNGE